MSENKLKVDNYSSDSSSIESEITESNSSEEKDKVINLQLKQKSDDTDSKIKESNGKSPNSKGFKKLNSLNKQVAQMYSE